MPTSENSKKRMNAAVEKAISEGNIIYANEITANVMVGTTLLIFFVVLFLCMILNEVGVFTVPKGVMRLSTLVAFLIESPATIINSKYVGTKKWLKQYLMVTLIIVCSILASTLGHNVTLVMAFPIVVSTRYFDAKYTRNVAFLTAFVFLAAEVSNAFVGVVNLNMVKVILSDTILLEKGDTLRNAIETVMDRPKYVTSLLVNDFIPRCAIFFALYSSCHFVADRGKKMVNSQADSAAKTSRIETELDLATKIQTSMLPCILPAFPGHENIELQAVYHPAKEVGGDFYDYFIIDKTHVGVVVADVSGKGVGAALFMTISKTVLKNQLQLGISPAEALMNANAQLCENNDAGLFVTCWAGVFDTETGVLCYVNAGHNPPVLIQKDKTPTFINQRSGFVLAGMEGFRYREEELKLNVGDEMFFYTDGVTEASNDQNELYGNERLLDCLESCQDKKVGEQLEILKGDIDKFVGGADQFDDITIMGMRIT